MCLHDPAVFNLYTAVTTSYITITHFYARSQNFQKRLLASDGEHHYALEIDKYLNTVYVKHNCFS